MISTDECEDPKSKRQSSLVRPLFMRQDSVTNNRTDRLSLTPIPSDQPGSSSGNTVEKPTVSRKKSLFRKSTLVGSKVVAESPPLEDNQTPLMKH